MNFSDLMKPRNELSLVELARKSPRPSWREVRRLLSDLGRKDEIHKDESAFKELWRNACHFADMERKSNVRFTKLERTAFHEAGHAVAAFCLHRRPTKASIVPEGRFDSGTLGHVDMQKFSKRNRDNPDLDDSVYGRPRDLIEREIMVYLAGDVGSRLLTGRADGARRGAGYDYNNAFSLAGTWMDDVGAYSDEGLGYYVSWLWERTKGLLDNPINLARMGAVAGALLKEREIGERRLREIISKAGERATGVE